MNHAPVSRGNKPTDAPKLNALKTSPLPSRSKQSLELPRPLRVGLIAVGFVGILGIIVESLGRGVDVSHLVHGDGQSIHPLDKLLHLVAYAILALTFTLGFKRRLHALVLLALNLMGLLIEFLQPSFGRTLDLGDLVANVVGSLFGFLLGSWVRTGYAYLRTEQVLRNVRVRKLRFEPGEVMMRQCEPAHQMYSIQEGNVQLFREFDGEEVPSGVAGPGDVLGGLAVGQGTSQFIKATSITKTTIYGMSIEQLLQSTGGDEILITNVLRTLSTRFRKATEAQSTDFEVEHQRSEKPAHLSFKTGTRREEG